MKWLLMFKQFIVQLGVNEMHLSQVGLGWILCHPRAMFDCLAEMSFSLDAQSG